MSSELIRPLPVSLPQSPRDIPRKSVVSYNLIPEPLLDTVEAASIMKIHPKTLQKLARSGVIRGIHIGKLWRFRASEIEQWIQRQLAS